MYKCTYMSSVYIYTRVIQKKMLQLFLTNGKKKQETNKTEMTAALMRMRFSRRPSRHSWRWPRPDNLVRFIIWLCGVVVYSVLCAYYIELGSGRYHLEADHDVRLVGMA